MDYLPLLVVGAKFNKKIFGAAEALILAKIRGVTVFRNFSQKVSFTLYMGIYRGYLYRYYIYYINRIPILYIYFFYFSSKTVTKKGNSSRKRLNHATFGIFRVLPFFRKVLPFPSKRYLFIIELKCFYP